MRTVAFRVDEVTFAKIDVLSRLSGLSKQDYMEARVLDESVVVVPSSRVAKMLLEYAQEVYRGLLRARREGRALDEDFAWSLHLVGIPIGFRRWLNARYRRRNSLMGASNVTSWRLHGLTCDYRKNQRVLTALPAFLATIRGE